MSGSSLVCHGLRGHVQWRHHGEHPSGDDGTGRGGAQQDARPLPGTGAGPALPWQAGGHGGHIGSSQGRPGASVHLRLHAAADMCLRRSVK